MATSDDDRTVAVCLGTLVDVWPGTRAQPRSGPATYCYLASPAHLKTVAMAFSALSALRHRGT
jgi:hypothetical protein